MSTITLNHALAVKRVNLTALVLLVTGVLISCLIINYHQSLLSDTRKLEANIDALSRAQSVRYLPKVNVNHNAQKTHDIAAVNAAIAEIVLPWNAIFKILEATKSDAVKLLAVEPSIKKQTLRITALALDVDSMMAYVDSLIQQKMLKNVALVSQESAEVNGQPAVHFVVETAW